MVSTCTLASFWVVSRVWGTSLYTTQPPFWAPFVFPLLMRPIPFHSSPIDLCPSLFSSPSLISSLHETTGSPFILLAEALCLLPAGIGQFTNKVKTLSVHVNKIGTEFLDTHGKEVSETPFPSPLGILRYLNCVRWTGHGSQVQTRPEAPEGRFVPGSGPGSLSGGLDSAPGLGSGWGEGSGLGSLLSAPSHTTILVPFDIEKG